MSDVIVGSCVSILGLLGLILAANALDDGMATFGFGLALFAAFFVFWIVKHRHDRGHAG